MDRILNDLPDIDIDLKDREEILSELAHIPASIHRPDKLEKHKSGVYFQKTPVDMVSGQCSLDHKKADQLGYVKIDLLHNHVYQSVRDPDHLDRLVEKEPDWSLLEHKEVIEELFQLHNHAELVMKLKPRSLEELAATIAVIRPAKRYLTDASWDQIHQEIWEETSEDEYQFRKSHAFAYALVIVVQLNLLVEELND